MNLLVSFSFRFGDFVRRFFRAALSFQLIPYTWYDMACSIEPQIEIESSPKHVKTRQRQHDASEWEDRIATKRL